MFVNISSFYANKNVNLPHLAAWHRIHTTGREYDCKPSWHA